jgi:hypothetical protein
MIALSENTASTTSVATLKSHKDVYDCDDKPKIRLEWYLVPNNLVGCQIGLGQDITEIIHLNSMRFAWQLEIAITQRWIFSPWTTFWSCPGWLWTLDEYEKQTDCHLLSDESNTNSPDLWKYSVFYWWTASRHRSRTVMQHT